MKKNVLIVDDNEINRGVLKEIFKNEFNIIEAKSGEEALEVIQMKSDEIALVLLDLMMGKMNGFDVLEQRNEMPKFKDIPVIVITGSTERDDQARAFELGANEYLTKQFGSIIVLSRVRNVMSLHKKMIEAKSQAENLKEISKKDGRFEADYVTAGVAKLFGYEDTKEFMDYYKKDAMRNVDEAWIEQKEQLEAALKTANSHNIFKEKE